MDGYVEGLFRDLGGRDGMARKRARESLVLLGDPAVPELRELLASPDKKTRWEAVKALAAIVDPETLDVLVDLLDDPNSDLRWLAATGLIALGPRSIRPVLKGLTDPGASRGRREMSRRVLAEASRDNGVLADIVAPLMEVIDGTDPAVISQRAARALSALDKAAGRTPPLDHSGS